MTVRVYKSTDTSAPALRGVAGDLITLLDACLVNGYGSATAAGWTKAYTGTNKAAYRNSASTGTGFYLNVDDSASGSGGAKEAFMTGFQTMSALATGTGQFPNSANLNIGTAPAGSVVWRKSNTADTTARAWVLVADETVFYLFIETGDYTSPTATFAFMFGDIFSFAATDPYRCMIIGGNAVNMDWQRSSLPVVNGAPNQTVMGHYMAADWSGASTSLAVGKLIDSVKMNRGGYGGGTGGTGTTSSGSMLVIGQDGQNPTTVTPYPNAVDGSVLMSPVWISYNNRIRGYLKGLWAPLHHLPFNHGDAFSGAGALAGKTLLSQWLASCTSGNSFNLNYANVVIETSNTWS